MPSPKTSFLQELKHKSIEEWPYTIGFLALITAHIVYYPVLGNEWRIGGPPLFIAILVLLLAEITRQLYARYQTPSEE